MPQFEFSTVGERLMAGRNTLSAHDVQALQARGVTHILDLREAGEWLQANGTR